MQVMCFFGGCFLETRILGDAKRLVGKTSFYCLSGEAKMCMRYVLFCR